MNEPPFSSPLEETVVIVGVGMIGGSLAAALKRRKIARRVIGVGRDQARIEAALAAGLIDEATTSTKSVIDRANLVVFCTPVERVASDVRAAFADLSMSVDNSNAQGPGSGLLLTDVGSVKGPICSDLMDFPMFVGSHPIAGSHRQGFEAADARLFEGRLCVLTPTTSTPEPSITRLDRFWRALGMRTISMSPVAHDAALAMTSHLPHLVAAALATTVCDDHRRLTGTGFRDTTRVAAGDPDLWAGILMNNADQVVNGIDEMQNRLTAYRNALANHNLIEIRQLLKDGQQFRMSLDETLHE
ncbi:MAG: prephenate dehydrogenase/arogenate dehydrogenase family protein [Schlesneria sp.]